jgi:FdhE protein
VEFPDPARLFAARAARLRLLAEGHPAGDWLRLLARIADGQGAAARDVGVPPVPAAPGGPPLAFDLVRRDATWRTMLRVVLSCAEDPTPPAETVQVVRRLAGAAPTWLEAIADRQLAGALPRDEAGSAPFVGAALQAWFAVLAGRLDRAPVGAPGTGCPACGAPPVAACIDSTSRRRRLACSLCATTWSVPRLTCASCGEDSGLAYFHVEGRPAAKAEACAGCGGYLKLFDLEEDPAAEAVADDTATLALDLLVAERGFGRIGVNHLGAAAAVEG